METFLIMGRNVLLFVALALPGYFMVKFKVLKEEHSGIISKLLMYAAFPMMIFHGTVEKISLSGAVFRDVALGAAVALAGLSLFALMAVIMSAKMKGDHTRGILRFSASVPNNGFLGVPLGMAVFGAASPVMPPLMSMNIITTVFLYTVGIYFVSGDKSAISPKKALLSPALIAFAAGILVNLSGVSRHIPEISSFTGHFSSLVTPLSMTVLGMKMGAASMKRIFANSRMFYLSFLKLILFPAVYMALLLALRSLFPVLSEPILLAAFVAFAMPTAGLAPTLADAYGGDTDSAVSFTLGTTVLSIVTIPLLYLAFTLLL